MRTRAMAYLALSLLSAASISRAADPLDQLLACRRLTDPSARLDCFDRASDTVAVKAAVPAGSVAAENGPIHSIITQVSQALNSRADFILENGQIWRQMDVDSAKSVKIGDRVEVSKMRFGAYWLKVQGGRSWRVTRIH